MKQSNKAFTFVELIIVLSIALIVMSVIWGFFSGFLRISSKGSGTVSALTEMSIAFSWLRRDLSNVLIHEPVTDNSGEVHQFNIERTISDGMTKSFKFYRVQDVIEQNAKPISGRITYSLEPSETEGYSLKRSIADIDGTPISHKTFLKGKIKKFAIECYKHVENEPSVLLEGPVISVINGNIPDSMKVIIEQEDSSRINAAIAINSPYVGDKNNDNYYASWLLQNIPHSTSSPDHVPKYAKKKAVNIKGIGSGIASWDEDSDEE